MLNLSISGGLVTDLEKLEGGKVASSKGSKSESPGNLLAELGELRLSTKATTRFPGLLEKRPLEVATSKPSSNLETFLLGIENQK